MNELAKEIHQQNVAAGWWKDMNRDLFQTLQLVSTELAEATEGLRKNLMDDHLPHRKMEEVELADALIRLLDLAGRYGWEYSEDDIPEKFLINYTNTVGGLHFVCNMALIDLAREIAFDAPDRVINCRYSELVNTILYVAQVQGYDVMAALDEKREYNKHRLDHKPEVRATEHGKKF